RVGVASHFDAQLRVALQDLDRLVEDRDGVRTQGRLVEVEVHALQVDRHGDRATVRTDGLAGLRIRAAVVAVVHAVAVAVHVGAARSGRGRRRGDRGGRLRTQRDHDADRGQHVAEPVFRRGADALVVEVRAVHELGADADAADIALGTDADLGG